MQEDHLELVVRESASSMVVIEVEHGPQVQSANDFQANLIVLIDVWQAESISYIEAHINNGIFPPKVSWYKYMRYRFFTPRHPMQAMLNEPAEFHFIILILYESSLAYVKI